VKKENDAAIFKGRELFGRSIIQSVLVVVLSCTPDGTIRRYSVFVNNFLNDIVSRTIQRFDKVDFHCVVVPNDKGGERNEKPGDPS
jgi:hypothetical protein